MPTFPYRKVKAPALSFGERTTEPIQKKNLVRAHDFRLTGDWKVAGGTGAGTILPDPHYRAFEKIEVAGNDRTGISIVGRTLARFWRFFGEGVLPQGGISALAAATDEASEGLIRIPYYMPHAFTGERWAFPTYATRSPEVAVTMISDMADLVTGEDGAVTFENASLEFYEEAQAGSGVNPADYSPLIIRTTTVPVTADEDDFLIELDNIKRGEHIRALFVEGEAVTDSVYQDNDAVFSKIGFDLDGRTIKEKEARSVYQRLNARAYDLAAVETGCVLFDAAEDRRTDPGELWQRRTEVKPTLVLDAAKQTGDTRIRVTSISTKFAGAR